MVAHLKMPGGLCNKYSYWQEEEIQTSNSRNTLQGASTNQHQLLGNQRGERMDKIGEANKQRLSSLTYWRWKARMRRRWWSASAFMKMEYGLDFVCRLVDLMKCEDSYLGPKSPLFLRCWLVSRCLPLSAPAWLKLKLKNK